jgi:hypothetical protein
MPIVQYKSSTLKLIELARKSFERATGKTIDSATAQDVEAWMHKMRHDGLSTNTCRTYLSLVKQLIAVEAQSPKRAPTVKRILNDDEIKHLLGIAPEKDYAWLAVALLSGPEAVGWTWGRLYCPESIVPMETYLVIVEEARRRGYPTWPSPYRGRNDVHWIGNYQPEGNIWSMSQHEINRRLKSIARKAGIGSENMNITTLRYTHEKLLARYFDTKKISKALEIRLGAESTEQKPKRDSRLYSIGRRSPAFIERA